MNHCLKLTFQRTHTKTGAFTYVTNLIAVLLPYTLRHSLTSVSNDRNPSNTFNPLLLHRRENLFANLSQSVSKISFCTDVL
jgi:hypothetical protein